MVGITANVPETMAADERFIASMADFSIDLFKQTSFNPETGSGKDNSLISPISLMIALTMTANGADQNTLSQMEKLLGKDIPLSDLNRYLYTYIKGLPSEEKSKLHIANSIWFKDEESLKIKNEFLQSNADHFGAEVYKSSFDKNTLNAVNQWVNDNTNGMIDKILDEINRNAVIYLINAVAFDAQWSHIYEEHNVIKGDFTNINNEKQSVDFMHSDESIYLADSKATGFAKPYANDKYSFVALLPNKDVPIESYVASLSGTGFVSMLKNAQNTNVRASLPKFSYDYEITLNDTLKTLGIPDAFSPSAANFQKMASSSDGNLYISDVLHKTFITVDERGTEAGAVTKVGIAKTSMPLNEKQVLLDRPFVYAIVDNATHLPIFIGTVTHF
jgi:serpin B